MASIESLIGGSEKLTSVYGQWPRFHDAEIIDLRLSRGDMERYLSPILTVKIHVFIEDPSSHHTLATLRFDDVEKFKMEGFNYPNAIHGISISAQERGEQLSPEFVVEFRAAFGMGATFHCFGIKVVDAIRCSENGNVEVELPPSAKL